MNPLGDLDEVYILARRTLLDALEMLGEHRRAVILVGAQAIYLQTGDGDLAVAPFTRDADLALDPRKLDPEPKIEDILRRHGYQPREHQIGVWRNASSGAQVDFLVPEAMSGAKSRRAAHLPTQGDRLARRTVGLEGVVIENQLMDICSLEPDDPRSFTVSVAGSAALFVAKITKIGERQEQDWRLNNKDAIDVVRLLRAITTEHLAAGLARLLDDPISSAVSEMSLHQLQALFGSPSGKGVQMAVRGLEPLELPEVVAASTTMLVGDLLTRVGEQLSRGEVDK